MKKVLSVIFILGFLIALGFGTATFFEAKKLSKHDKQQVQYEKDYTKQDKKIKQVKVNGEISNIKIQQGNHFKVEANGESMGKINIKSYIKDGTLVVNESYHQPVVNFNFMNNNDLTLLVTVPDDMLDRIETHGDTGQTTIQGIKTKQLIAYTDTDNIEVKDSNIDYMELKADTANINVINTHFKDATADADTGDIIFRSIFGDVNVDAKSDTGNIELNYKTAPENTKVVISNKDDQMGNLQINQPELKAKKYGDGSYTVQISSESGLMKIN